MEGILCDVGPWPMRLPEEGGALEPTIDPHAVVRDHPDLLPVQPQLNDCGDGGVNECRVGTMQTEQVVLDRGRTQVTLAPGLRPAPPGPAA